MDTQKQQVVDRLKKANNVLVTVTSDPSVDQLAAAIGFSLVLNGLDKHATAVYSGETPSVIEFLQPGSTLEKTTDSLRDFIISLDKDKADKLRYKVEDRLVRIFITPYRTSISQDDLEFSQGDFNVDVVVALGVHDQSEIDQAITAHGRILHDAAVITITNDRQSDLGAINLFDETASSLSEVVAGVTTLLSDNILDKQIATALLTGIVAETGRFGNERTTAETMRLSSMLLAAGADQQLVATKLEPEPTPVPEPAHVPAPVEPDLAASLESPSAAPQPEATTQTQQLPTAKPSQASPEPSDDSEVGAEIHIDADGTLQITHERHNQAHHPEPEAETNQDKPEPEQSPPPEPTKIAEPAIIGQPPAASPQAVTAPLSAIEPTPASGPTLTAPLQEPVSPLVEPEPKLPELPKPSAEHPSISHTFLDEKKPLTESDLENESPAAATQTIPMLTHGGAPTQTATAADEGHAASEQETVDAARDAVLHAMGTAANQPLPPVTALNAQPLGGPVHEQPDQAGQTMTLPVPGGIPQFTPETPTDQPPAGPGSDVQTPPSSAPPVPPPVFPFSPPKA